MKHSVDQLAKICQVTVGELAVKCDIDPDHLERVASGRTKMTAQDLYLLSVGTGIPADDIQS